MRSVQSIIATGNSGLIVDIECHLSNNLPNIVIVGFANKAVDESRERIRGAFASSRIMLPRKRVLINLAPADVPKADCSFDLAIAMAIMQAGGQVPVSATRYQAFIGELGLDGSTRPVRGIIGKIMLGRAKGITTFYIPLANLSQAQLVPNVTLIPIDSLAQLCGICNHLVNITPVLTGSGGTYQSADDITQNAGLQLSDISGQSLAKRALEIAAAGGHNLLLSGPPGTGKSMLAKAMPSILPQLSREEILEVTHLHSLASRNYEQIIVQRPFRAPHHGASIVAITGGGSTLQPGELSLAHRGVLFFDELPEFSRTCLESLRQPLEDHQISVARAAGLIDFPANFILVATANPCACGFYGTAKPCNCSSGQMKNYRNRLSGPILDRIDLHCPVGEIEHTLLLDQKEAAVSDSTDQIRSRVASARQAQAQRLGNSRLNADMTNQEAKQLAQLTPPAIDQLNMAARQYSLSARAYMRTIKVARTIADLCGATTISQAHMDDALAYRYHNPRHDI